MKKISFFTLVISIFLLLPSILQADEVSDLKNEIEDLKMRMEVLEAEGEDLGTKLTDRLTLSGYADGEYIMNDKSGSKDGFRVHHLSLFFKKDISPKWRLFSEIEYEDAPKVGEEETVTVSGTDINVSKNREGKIFVEVFTLEYLHSQYLNFRLGRYLTPAGIWNVEHYPPFVSTQERPQHIRKIFPQLNDGLQLYGTTNLGSVVTDYIAYVGNGSGNTGHGDNNDNKAVGGRLKFKFPVLSRTELGLSAYREKENDDDEKRAYGFDLSLQWKKLKFQGEYATASMEPLAGGDYDMEGYYGQLAYGVGSWDLIYRYDWYDANDTGAYHNKTVNTLGMNYHFNPSVVGKIEHHMNDEDDPSKEDYDKTILSIAVYLGE